MKENFSTELNAIGREASEVLAASEGSEKSANTPPYTIKNVTIKAGETKKITVAVFADSIHYNIGQDMRIKYTLDDLCKHQIRVVGQNSQVVAVNSTFTGSAFSTTWSVIATDNYVATIYNDSNKTIKVLSFTYGN